MIWRVQMMRGNSSSLARFLSSSCPSHASWNWLGASCCPALLLLQRDSILYRWSWCCYHPLLISSPALPTCHSPDSHRNVSAREAVGPSDDGRLAVAPGCWGINLLTDRRFGWRPLEAAPSPSVPLSPLVDISLVWRGWGWGGEGGGIWRWLLGEIQLCVARTKVNTVLTKVNTVLNVRCHST